MMQSRMQRIQRIHFIGIGGSGMCGIAEILHHQGFSVTGSDQFDSANCVRLRALGVPVAIGHTASQVEGADAVVISSAIHESNPEVQAARHSRLPVVPRAVMLGELMRYRSGIAVAGTHGKTTTTSMLAMVFDHAGLDPTYVVGGKLQSIGTNAYLGKGDHLITEADESDASFIHLQPHISIVTNIEFDHMGNYGNDPERLYAIFVQFLHNLPFYGLAVLCADDPAIGKIIPRLSRPLVTYGFDSQANYIISNYAQQGTECSFCVTCPDGVRLDARLCVPGKHNALNATACIAVARDIQIPVQTILDGLSAFCGVGRRFEQLGQFPAPQDAGARGVTLLDDYGHHPTELACTLATAREAWPDRRLVMLFQPHRYTRTRDLYDEFIDVLIKPDVLVLMETYPAGEQPISGFASKNLATSVRQRGMSEVTLAASLAKLNQLLPNLLRDGDLLITQGAGNVSQVATSLRASQLVCCSQ